MTEITLRPYQQEAISAITAQPPGSYLVQMPTGCGKTVTFANLPRDGKRMLILSHREELVEQPRKYFDCSYGVERAGSHSHGEDVVSASVQSMVRRLDRYRPDDFGLIIVDECFPAGTMVDGRRIEDIKIGDTVTAFNHATGSLERKRVTHTFKHRRPKRMIRINGTLVCTPNHPVYETSKGRYVDAEKIEPGDCLLLRVRAADSVGGYDKIEKGKLSEERESVLLRRAQIDFPEEDLVGNHGKNESEVCVLANERKEPDEKDGMQEENVGNSAQDRAYAESARRERNWHDETARDSDGKAFWHGTCQRICCGNRCKEDREREPLSDELQNRHCNSVRHDRDRSGRKQPLLFGEEEAGCEEGGLLEIRRVDSVEVLECADNREPGGLCSDGYIYNLEVEGLNNYFANGYLVHNCHHSAARTYKKILNYFRPEKVIGFTATPNRADHVRLDDIFQKIIFQRDIRWAIKQGYLCDILCKRVNIGYDLSKVHTRLGDYAPGELDEAMDGTADAIAQAYREEAEDQTIIFAVSVRHAHEISDRIPGAVVVTGETKDRAEIIQRFTRGEIPCIVNVMVFTEGTDIPCIKTGIIARPTQSESLYTQMVGRILRPYKGKSQAILIDCVGISGSKSLCTAPSLLGIDMSMLPAKQQAKIQGNLFDLPDKIAKASDTPESWIRNVEIVDLWAKEGEYNLRGINFFQTPAGELVVTAEKGKTITIPAPDALGNVPTKDGGRIYIQDAIDRVFVCLRDNYSDSRYLWDRNITKRWADKPASESQLKIINRVFPDFDTGALTKGEASNILNRMFYRRKSG